MGIENEKSLVPATEEIRKLVQKAYDAGCARGRAELLALQGIDTAEAGVHVKLLRRHFAELTEQARFDVDVSGDEQRIEVIKDLLTQWRKIASVIIREAVESHNPTRH
jgi:hypothetical protein